MQAHVYLALPDGSRPGEPTVIMSADYVKQEGEIVYLYRNTEPEGSYDRYVLPVALFRREDVRLILIVPESETP